MSGPTNSTSNSSGGSGDTPSDSTAGFIELIGLLTSQTDGKRLAVALLTWVMYDFLLTIDDSINLFWTYRWSMVKILYLISRYDTVFTMAFVVGELNAVSPSRFFCNAAPWVQITGSGLVILAINIAMAARVYAIWERSIRILIISVTGLIINFGGFFIMLPYSFSKAQISPSSPPFTGCVINANFDGTWVIFVINIAYETMIIGLTIYKSWSVTRQSGIRTPLYTLILGDGVAYYILIIASQILSLIAALVPTSFSLVIILPSPSIAVTGIAGNRLFIRLQRHLLRRLQGMEGAGTEATKGQTSFLRSLHPTNGPTASLMEAQRLHRSVQPAGRTLVRTESSRGRIIGGTLQLEQEIDLSAHLKGSTAGDALWSHEMQDLEKRTIVRDSGTGSDR